jgi:hypothetical protein
MGTATIIGGDPRMSVCAGGTFIKIDGHPNPNDPTHGYYDIDSTPSTFSLMHLKYPTRVRLDWHISPKCYGNYVDITRIEIIY